LLHIEVYLSVSFPVVYFVACILKLTFLRILILNKTVFPFLAGGGDHPPPPWRSVKDKAYSRSQVAPSM
jgi:hypothetical protein